MRTLTTVLMLVLVASNAWAQRGQGNTAEERAHTNYIGVYKGRFQNWEVTCSTEVTRSESGPPQLIRLNIQARLNGQLKMAMQGVAKLVSYTGKTVIYHDPNGCELLVVFDFEQDLLDVYKLQIINLSPGDCNAEFGWAEGLPKKLYLNR